MRNYEAPALHILAVEAVDVLLASNQINNGGTGTEEGGGDVVIHAASPAVNIFN